MLEAVGEKAVLKPDWDHNTSKHVAQIREHMQSKQKSYANIRRRCLMFQVRDYVPLKVSPTKGVMRFGTKGRLSLRYIDPFLIVAWIGKLAYRLELLNSMMCVDNVLSP